MCDSCPVSHQPIQQDVYAYNQRPEVARFIPQGASSAMDVGCAVGGFGESLRQKLGAAARIVGIDPVPAAAEAARASGHFDVVLDGYYPNHLPDSESVFDLICFNDVLEHTIDPWEVLVQTKSHLTRGGHVLACIPNVQYAPVMWNLIRGDFTYTESGIMDKTHLRFFTHRTMNEMFESCGYRIVASEGVNNIIHDIPALGLGHRRKLRHLLGSAQWMQYVILAQSP